MNSRLNQCLILAIYLNLLFAITDVIGQSYSIVQGAIVGGGGQSSGDEFSIYGTIGLWEINASSLNAGSFVLNGGFRRSASLPVAEEDPSLIVAHGDLPGEIILSWDAVAGLYELQETSDLASGFWISHGIAESPVTLITESTPKFYRLINIRP